MTEVRQWEVGSAHPWSLPAGAGWQMEPDRVRLYGSGRQALAALLDLGSREYGWTTVHLPEYYCPEVVSDLAAVLAVRRYDAGPAGMVSAPVAGPADVVVTVSYFGDPPAVPLAVPATGPLRRGTRPALVVDATHDPIAPWLSQTPADYVFASLRKTMPLPDGGALWTGNRQVLPPDLTPTAAHLGAVSHVLSAMCLKAAYLAGAAVSKERYLALHAAGEDRLATTEVSGISEYSRQALGVLDTERLSRCRSENGRLLASALDSLPGLTASAHPLGVVLRFRSTAAREAVRAGLVERHVYPAVLWTLPKSSPHHHHGYSATMLFLHCDFRWNADDMRRTAALVREVYMSLPKGTPC